MVRSALACKENNNRHRRLGALVTLWIVMCAAVLAVPAVVYADDFSIDRVTIDATVGADGVLKVTETRTFDLHESVNGVFWTIPHAANIQGVSAKIDDISIEDPESGRAFSLVSSAQPGDEDVFSVEQTATTTTIKVFSPHEAGPATFVLSYEIVNPVMLWSDTAELYWKFIGDEWAVDTENVDLTINLPVPEGADLTSVESDQPLVRAWGHGPLTGEVKLEDGGRTIQVHAPHVPAYQFAEVRVAFPGSWLTDMLDAGSADARLEMILEEERLWAEDANNMRAHAKMVTGAAVVVGMVLPSLIVAVLLVRILRAHMQQRKTQGMYYRDIPSADHPAVLATFYNKGKFEQRAITSTLMKLTDDKLIGLEMKKGSDSFVLHLLCPDYEQREDIDELDKLALKIFFPKGKDVVTKKEIKSFSSQYSEMHYDNIEAFQAAVDTRYELSNYISSEGTAFAVIADIAAIVLTVISGVLSDEAYWYAPVVVSMILTFVIFALSSKRVVKYSQQGQELKDKCDGLKNWFCDFTRLKEAVPQDVILWNKLLVVAVALGVSQQVIKELALLMPQKPYEEDGYTYYPAYYWWYGHHGSHAAPAAALDQMFARDMREMAASSMSSGAGTGGGFSVGGGGGTGGGGGGTF